MNTRNRVFAFVCLFAVLSISNSVSSATVLALSLEDLAGRADIVVRGVATEIETHRNNRGDIVRSVSYRVGEYIKGDGNKKTTVRLQGGELDGIGRLVPGEVDLEVGEETILFLKKIKSQENTHRIVGLSQGRFIVEKNTATNELHVSRPLSNINMVGNPQNDSHNLGQNKTPVYMKLSVFVEAVKSLGSN